MSIHLIFIWYGDHSGGATPGLVSITEVKSSSVLDCTVGAGLWELHDVAGLFIFILLLFVNSDSKILFSLIINIGKCFYLRTFDFKKKYFFLLKIY